MKREVILFRLGCLLSTLIAAAVLSLSVWLPFVNAVEEPLPLPLPLPLSPPPPELSEQHVRLFQDAAQVHPLEFVGYFVDLPPGLRLTQAQANHIAQCIRPPFESLTDAEKLVRLRDDLSRLLEAQNKCATMAQPNPDLCDAIALAVAAKQLDIEALIEALEE